MSRSSVFLLNFLLLDIHFLLDKLFNFDNSEFEFVLVVHNIEKLGKQRLVAGHQILKLLLIIDFFEKGRT